jgi:hypothetical protein
VQAKCGGQPPLLATSIVIDGDHLLPGALPSEGRCQAGRCKK